MIDHITIQVNDLANPDWPEFFDLVEMKPCEVDDAIEEAYNVLWYRGIDGVQIHLVVRDDEVGLAAGAPNPGWSHFCVRGIGADRFAKAAESDFCERNSGSGRCWLRLDTVRVEVRP